MLPRQIRRQSESISLETHDEVLETTTQNNEATLSAAAMADELATLQPRSAKTSRITPRNSNADDLLLEAATDTPYEILKQLANIQPRPQTPIRRASNAGPTSTYKSIRKTPGVVTPGTSRRMGSARQPAVATPHAQAAQRGLEERRNAALTPGRRRQSIRQQKDTPRDALRLLSNLLAPGTAVIPSSSPNSVGPADGRVALRDPDDSIDDFDTRPPRLSVSFLGDDDEDSELLPPRTTSVLDDDTQVPIEQSRRANSELPRRLERGSLGNIRTSDAFNLGLENTIIDDIDSSFIGPGIYDDDDQGNNTTTALQDFTIGNIRQAFFSRDPFERASAGTGRLSDISSGVVLPDETETSFALTVPRRESGDIDVHSDGLLETNEEALKKINNAKNSEDDVFDDEADTEPEDVSMIDLTIDMEVQAQLQKPKRKKSKAIKVSQHGIQYTSLPTGVIKKLATTFMKTSGNSKAKLSKETLEAVVQASDWFFEQISDDLGTYSKHAKRRTIDESDIVTLMNRQGFYLGNS